MSRPSRLKTQNRFTRLTVEEPAESDESVASHATGTRVHQHHTRNNSVHDASSSLPVNTRVESALLDAIHIINSIPQKPEWWSLASTRLLDVLQPALDLVTSLPSNHVDLGTQGLPSSTQIPVQDVLPGPHSPDVSLQSFCPQPLTVLDVEAAVARALPAILQSELARGLKDLRDTLQTGQNGSTGDAQWTRAQDCCSSNHQPLPPPAPPPPPNERDLFVTLANVPSTDAAHALSELEVKVLVDSKLTRTASKGSSLPAVHGVKKLANGTLRIRATSEDVRDVLLKNPADWLPALGAGAQIARERFAVEVRAVPTTFCPDEDTSTQVVFQANAGVIPAATSILSMRWLRELSSDKATSSLIIELDTLKTFSEVVYSGVSIRGRMCDAVPYIPAPLQCFFCQGWGHTISACARKKANLTIICARCAGPHATGACSCPHTPRCSSLRNCAHIVLKCANCGGSHKSLSADCPIRRRAAAEVARQPRYARLLAAYSSPPPHVGRVSAGDPRTSLSFSESPRAGSAWRD